MRFLCLFFPFPLFAQMAVALDRMNVVYPGGIANPVSVVVSTVPDSNLALIPSVGQIKRIATGKYHWMICTLDTPFAQLIIRDIAADTTIEVTHFRVKKLPMPVAYLGRCNSTKPIGSGSKPVPQGEFCCAPGVSVVLENFDFDFRCDVVHYDVMRVPKNSDSYQCRNQGARFSGEIQDMVNRAVPGDLYYFFHIAYRCGCDPMVRYLSDEMVFEIK